VGGRARTGDRRTSMRREASRATSDAERPGIVTCGWGMQPVASEWPPQAAAGGLMSREQGVL
jgi:hypothetical protein